MINLMAVWARVGLAKPSLPELKLLNLPARPL